MFQEKLDDVLMIVRRTVARVKQLLNANDFSHKCLLLFAAFESDLDFVELLEHLCPDT